MTTRSWRWTISLGVLVLCAVQGGCCSNCPTDCTKCPLDLTKCPMPQVPVPGPIIDIVVGGGGGSALHYYKNRDTGGAEITATNAVHQVPEYFLYPTKPLSLIDSSGQHLYYVGTVEAALSGGGGVKVIRNASGTTWQCKESGNWTTLGNGGTNESIATCLTGNAAPPKFTAQGGGSSFEGNWVHIDTEQPSPPPAP